MPIYEYQCQKCKKVHEIWQKITEDPVTKCPACKGKLERLMSAVGFELKGGGWYKDGYASKPGATVDASASEAKPEKSEKSEKSDKAEKPAAKAEKSEAKAEVKAKNDKAPRTDPKHKSNSPKAKG